MKLLDSLKHGSWASFLREIAIIVIGVLPALAAGEVADDWNWQRRVAAVFCKARGLPLADWQQKLATMPARPLK